MLYIPNLIIPRMVSQFKTYETLSLNKPKEHKACSAAGVERRQVWRDDWFASSSQPSLFLHLSR